MLMSPAGRRARLQFLPNGTRMLAPGDHVVCAVTGEAIPIEQLRYWSVERQEAYASAAIAARALAGA